jgi:hypothetical protein
MKHKIVRRTLAVLVALALTSILFACGGGSSSSTPSTGGGATLSGSAQ